MRSSAVIRVKGPRRYSDLGLTERDLLGMYYKMVLSRTIDERVWILNRQGKASFVISSRGHEAAQVGSAYALERGKDFVLPYYRDMALILALGVTAREVMLAFLAKGEDPCSGGRQMPGHWSYPKLNIITASSPVATQIPQAAGIALASRIKGDTAVTIVYFGDGATSKGDFHEGLNFAGIHRVPVVFFCENNAYAISVPQNKQMAIKDVAERAVGYGFPGVVVDGNDILAVYQVTKTAMDRARRGEGPTLIEAKTYRLTPHSSNDDDRRYRSREEVDEWTRKDPISRFKASLEEEHILTNDMEKDIRDRAMREVDDALEYAEKSPYPSPEELLTYVYHS